MGKRARRAETIDDQWNNMMAGSDDDENASMTPNGTGAASNFLGIFKKRQRVNSASTKFEFSFRPTGKCDLL